MMVEVSEVLTGWLWVLEIVIDALSVTFLPAHRSIPIVLVALVLGVALTWGLQRHRAYPLTCEPFRPEAPCSYALGWALGGHTLHVWQVSRPEYLEEPAWSQLGFSSLCGTTLAKGDAVYVIADAYHGDLAKHTRGLVKRLALYSFKKACPSCLGRTFFSLAVYL